jgi:hypothetical protein
MATVLLGEIKNNVSQNQNQIDLTPTGLLMEGVITHDRQALLNKCNGDLSPTVPMRLNYSRIAPGKRRNAVE